MYQIYGMPLIWFNMPFTFVKWSVQRGDHVPDLQEGVTNSERYRKIEEIKKKTPSAESRSAAAFSQVLGRLIKIGALLSP